MELKIEETLDEILRMNKILLSVCRKQNEFLRLSSERVGVCIRKTTEIATAVSDEDRLQTRGEIRREILALSLLLEEHMDLFGDFHKDLGKEWGEI